MPFIKRRLPLGRQPRKVKDEGEYNSDTGVAFVRKGKKPRNGWIPITGETTRNGVVGTYYDTLGAPREEGEVENQGFIGRSAEKFE